MTLAGSAEFELNISHVPDLDEFYSNIKTKDLDDDVDT